MGLFGHSTELIIIFVVALLIFGPKKLPEMGSAIGKSIKEFRKGMNELTGAKDEKEPSPANFEAIEREITSKKYVPEYSEIDHKSAITSKKLVPEYDEIDPEGVTAGETSSTKDVID